jgi:hypothetical protein
MAVRHLVHLEVIWPGFLDYRQGNNRHEHAAVKLIP